MLKNCLLFSDISVFGKERTNRGGRDNTVRRKREPPSARTHLSVLSALLTNWALIPDPEVAGTSLSVGSGERGGGREQCLKPLEIFKPGHLALNCTLSL